ncbi:MAG: hypothetical protein EAZ59_09100 [Oscillatoriales cyanobacterium]|nr:MAG: hypothetical protein EAZ59_09100 [Oscillatoriales cyanobacterium]
MGSFVGNYSEETGADGWGELGVSSTNWLCRGQSRVSRKGLQVILMGFLVFCKILLIFRNG